MQVFSGNVQLLTQVALGQAHTPEPDLAVATFSRVRGAGCSTPRVRVHACMHACTTVTEDAAEGTLR